MARHFVFLAAFLFLNAIGADTNLSRISLYKNKPKSRENVQILVDYLKSKDKNERLASLDVLMNQYCPYLRASDFETFYAAAKEAVVLKDSDPYINLRLAVEVADSLVPNEATVGRLKKDLDSKDKGTRLAAAEILSVLDESSIIPKLISQLKGADYIAAREITFALFRMRMPVFSANLYQKYSDYWAKNKQLFPFKYGPFPRYKGNVKALPKDLTQIKSALSENSLDLRFVRDPGRLRHFTYDMWHCRGSVWPRAFTGPVAIRLIGFSTQGDEEVAQILLLNSKSFCSKDVATLITPIAQSWLDVWKEHGANEALNRFGSMPISGDALIYVPLLDSDGVPTLWYEKEKCD